MNALKAIALATLLSLVYGCSHPIEIVGEGDVLSASGTRNCYYEDYLAGAENCSKNLVVHDYYETYYAVPRDGWEFEQWLNYSHCADSGNVCAFDISADGVKLGWGQTVSPLVAVFSEVDPSSCDDKYFESSWFCWDAEALDVLLGSATVTLPLSNIDPYADEFGLRWRIILALRQIGYEPHGINTGEVIDADRLRSIDRELATMEKTLDGQAEKLENYYEISAPDFLDNLPQSFAAHLFATIFDLMNAGEARYQAHSNECVLANLVPYMCGALVDMGVSSGSCKVNPVFLDQLTVQTPELFGFNNRRDAITDSEHPNYGGVSSTYSYVSTLVHEMVHDLDTRFAASSNEVFDRRNVCSSTLMSFTGIATPFDAGVANFGRQDIDDYVSHYAAGLSNPNQDYRWYEDAAETVTAYILLPEYFRDRMQYSTALEARYNFVRDNVFGGVEFINPDLTGTDYSAPLTISSFARVNALARFRITSVRPLPQVIHD